MFANSERVQCTRCRNIHLMSERLDVRDKSYEVGMMVSVCPRCSCRNFYRQPALKSGGKNHE